MQMIVIFFGTVLIYQIFDKYRLTIHMQTCDAFPTDGQNEMS